jgi:hypothetical protein
MNYDVDDLADSTLDYSLTEKHRRRLPTFGPIIGSRKTRRDNIYPTCRQKMTPARDGELHETSTGGSSTQIRLAFQKLGFVVFVSRNGPLLIANVAGNLPLILRPLQVSPRRACNPRNRTTLHGQNSSILTMCRPPFSKPVIPPHEQTSCLRSLSPSQPCVGA